MNSANQNNTPNVKQENVVAGVVGAFLFSLVGGILWFLLDRIGFVAGISGIVGVIAANRGYSFFAKGSSKKGIILSTVIAALVLVLAWYLCFSLDLMEAYQAWYEAGEVDYVPNYFECISHAYLYLSDSELAFSYVSNLLIGLALCAVATFPTFKQLMAQEKLAKEAPVDAQFSPTPDTQGEGCPVQSPECDSSDAQNTSKAEE